MTASASTAVIRQWARDNGLPVGERGRLSPQLLDAYASSNVSKPRSVKDGGGLRPPRTPVGRRGAAVRMAVQPTPGATGIARRIAARSD